MDTNQPGCWHVVADKGKNIRKQFGTDIESDTDMETTIKKDDIILTTHYRIIYDKVVNVASIMRINLFENLIPNPGTKYSQFPPR